MQKTKFNFISNIGKIFCVACILAMLATSVCIYHASVPKLCEFGLFILLFVQLPGSGIIKMLKMPTKHCSERILIGFFTGWALIIAEYFICDITTISVFYYLNLLLSTYYIYSSYKDGSLNASTPRRIYNYLANTSIALYVFVVLALLYVLLLTQYKYLAPGTGAHIFSTSDKAFQMGIINSLVNDFPVVNPWVDGMTIHYHLFTQIVYAAAITVFPQLTSDFIIMSCSPYLLVLSLGVSFYAMFRRFCKRADRAGIYTLLVLLSNPFLARTAINSYIFRILLVNDNFAGFGVAAAIAWIITLDIYYKDAKNNRASVAMLLVVEMMLLTGIKAPMAVVMLGALFGTIILSAIMKEFKASNLGLVAVSAIGFALLYKVLLASNDSLPGGSSSVLSFAKINNLCFWKKPLIDFLVGCNVPGTIRLLIIMLIFFISFFSIFFFPMCVGYIREFVLVITRKKEFDIPRITIYAAVLLGTLLTLFTNYAGHSQIYFGIIGFAFSSIIAFWFFEDVGPESVRWLKRIRKACICLFSITLVVSTVALAVYINHNVEIAIKKSNPQASFSKYRSLNVDELEAMEWIKANTPEDSLIATQMYASVPHDQYTIDNRYQNCHFLYAVYSCRNYYLEGSGFSIDSNNLGLRRKMLAINAKLFDISNEDRGELANSLGVDYVVVTKFVDGPLELDNEDYEKCFSNKTIDIYKISNP